MLSTIKGLLLGALIYILWDKFGVLGLLVVPAGLLAMLWLNQDNLLYRPVRCVKYRQQPPRVPPLGTHYDDITLVCMDGTKISAWFIRQPDQERRPTLIFLHGNAGHMADRLDNARGLFVSLLCNVLMVEYRGYGTSEGEPSEDGLRLDAQAALDYLHSRRDVDHTNVFVFGRSLGGAVCMPLLAPDASTAATRISPYRQPYFSLQRIRVPWPHHAHLSHKFPFPGV